MCLHFFLFFLGVVFRVLHAFEKSTHIIASFNLLMLKGNFTNWTSRNEKIDNFIQEMQLKIDKWNDLVFEWIPYNRFSDIKKTGSGGFATVYSAIWKDGPLNYH